jgi:hypothetical protein
MRSSSRVLTTRSVISGLCPTLLTIVLGTIRSEAVEREVGEVGTVLVLLLPAVVEGAEMLYPLLPVLLEENDGDEPLLRW